MNLDIPRLKFSYILKVFLCSVTLGGDVTYSEIRTFLKREHTENTMYLSIATSESTIISLSENHLIFARKNCADKFYPM